MTANTLKRIMTLSGRAPHVYAVLLRLAHERGADTVEAGAAFFESFGTGPLAYYRAVAKLPKANLIMVEKAVGQRSRFRLLLDPGRRDGTIIDIPARHFEIAMGARGRAFHAFLLAWELAKSAGKCDVVLRRDLHYQFGLTAKTLKLALRELRRHGLAETSMGRRWRIMVRVKCKKIPDCIGDTHMVECMFGSGAFFAAAPVTDHLAGRGRLGHDFNDALQDRVTAAC